MSKFFINRPIVAMVISILMVIVGAITIVTPPGLAVPHDRSARSSGADDLRRRGRANGGTIRGHADRTADERRGQHELHVFRSTQRPGEMRLIVDFDVKTDPNTDLILTQMRETQAAPQLPADVTNFGVTVQKSLTAPLMLISLYSPSGTYDAKFLANYAYINLNDQLTRVPGIGSVQVFGAGQYAMRFWVKPDQLAKLDITVPEIVNAIQSQNTVNPAGQIGRRARARRARNSPTRSARRAV